MNKHHGEHSGHHKHHPEGPLPEVGLRRHKKWIVAAIVLMLAGMAMYVFTMDEADPPGGAPQEPMPADAAL